MHEENKKTLYITAAFAVTFIVIVGCGRWMHLADDQVVVFVVVATFVTVSIQLERVLSWLSAPEVICYLKALVKEPIFWVACTGTIVFVWIVYVARNTLAASGG